MDVLPLMLIASSLFPFFFYHRPFVVCTLFRIAFAR